MARRKILWLTSWYPNRNDAFDGDFIQRHARAAAIDQDIHVIFVTASDISEMQKEELHRATGLTEQLVYFRQKKGWFASIRKQLTWKKVFQQSIDAYIKTHGRPDAVHVHIPWKAGLMGLWLKRARGIPYLVSEHWGMYDGTAPDDLSRRPPMVQSLLRQIYAEAQAFTAPSRFLLNAIEKAAGKKSGILLPNVVDTSLFFYHPDPYAKFTLVHVSNMAPVKDVAGLLEAFSIFAARHEDVQLIMIGNRDQTYVALAGQLHLLNRKVFFMGEIPYASVAQEMKRVHALVLFSRSETFSCVTAEALCSGLPVLATQAGALPELVNESNGILVPPGNVQALAGAMKELHDTYTRFDRPSIAAAAARQYGYSALSEQFNALYHTF